MPLFEFRCLECGEKNEILVKSSSSSTLQCQSCGGEKLEKLLSIPSSLSGAPKSSGCDFQSGPACEQMAAQGACNPGTCCGGMNF